MLRWFERSMVYVPEAGLAASAESLARTFEDVHFAARDGVRLHGWFFPAVPESARVRLVLLILHGNAGNVGHRLEYIRAWLELGLNVFVFDYRGFGRSAGTPGEEGTYLDAEAAREWLVGKGFAPGEIVLLGKSLGGGVASELAARQAVGGLILQNTFTSMPAIGAELYPWLPVRWMSSIKYDTGSKLPRVHLPVLILHSREDRMIRFHHGERNFASANEPKMFWEIKGGHNETIDQPGARKIYLEGLDQFLTRYFAADRSSPTMTP